MFLLLTIAVSHAAAQSRVLVMDNAPARAAAAASALRRRLAGAEVVTSDAPNGATGIERAASAQAVARANGADAAVWEDTPNGVHTVRAVPAGEGSTREATLPGLDAESFAVVAASLLVQFHAEETVPPPTVPVPVEALAVMRIVNEGGSTICGARSAAGPRRVLDPPIAAHAAGTVSLPRGALWADLALETCGGTTLWSGRPDPRTTLAVDYAAPGPTAPLMLALSARASVGEVWGGQQTAYGIWQAEARIGASFGDFGVALVLRAGAAYLGQTLDSTTFAGTAFAGDAQLAVLGTRAPHGFFARGAYFGVGGGTLFDTKVLAWSFQHPLVWFADYAYLGADVTAHWQLFGAGWDRGFTSPFIAVSFALQIVVID